MSLPFNPLQLQTYDITQKDQARMFVLQLANMLNQAFTPNGLAAILATAGVLQPGAMSSAANTLIGNNTGAAAADAGLTVAQVGAMFAGSAAINGSALVANSVTAAQVKSSLTDLGSPAGNSTIDT